MLVNIWLELKKFKLPTLYWYGNKNLELEFPSNWDVKIYPMNGHNEKPLSMGEIKDAFYRPINSKTIKELTKGRKEAVIIFDDMSRPTKIYELIPFILEQLNDGGISDDHIRFISALGTHGPMDYEDFVKKLGENIVERFSVFNHNPFGNITDIGTTSRGTPVEINNEVMDCELKIGIGCVLPHGQSGFGGGGKIILPGVASFKSIYINHKLPRKWGIIEDNITRLDIEEAAIKAGLDIKIDCVLNGKGKICGLYVGNVIDEFKEAVKHARKVYSTNIPKGFDVVIANSYFKANEVPLTIRIIRYLLKEGGTAVIIANNPKGPVVHYLEGKFGKFHGGPFYHGIRKLEGIGKVIIFTQQKMRDPWYPLFDPKEMMWLKNWKEVTEEIRNAHGDAAKIAIIPDATVQIPQEVIK
jgi:nickel-dependent lactate racemase